MLSFLTKQSTNLRMTQNYTANDLVRYIYRETSDNENAAILMQLECDEQFKNEYLILLKGFSKLSAPNCLPKIETENFILNYSKKLLEHS